MLRQSYANYEYIIVNNCSTDRSLDARAELREERPGVIRVVDYDVFVSQSQHYNRALQLISGKSKYCKMVQADDWIFPECLSKMTALAETKPSRSAS